jgi:hypothetical protein
MKIQTRNGLLPGTTNYGFVIKLAKDEKNLLPSIESDRQKEKQEKKNSLDLQRRTRT